MTPDWVIMTPPLVVSSAVRILIWGLLWIMHSCLQSRLGELFQLRVNRGKSRAVKACNYGALTLCCWCLVMEVKIQNMTGDKDDYCQSGLAA